ncbi:FlxA-like family protein [Serratia sp. 2723]|uniref:FlxA-like family protein n=1 Tax=unclassified Serratia (in: enterobacteria) TaxID=2647522 RepID=UPI003D1EC86C
MSIDIKMNTPITIGSENIRTEKSESTDDTGLVTPKDGSAASRIKALYKQIENLMKQLEKLSEMGLKPEELKKMRQLIMNQIKMLQVEIERIRKEELEKQQQTQIAKTIVGDGVNNPTAVNTLDVYI